MNNDVIFTTSLPRGGVLSNTSLDLIYIKAQRWLEVILICFCAFLYYLSLKKGSDKKVKTIIYKLNRRRKVWKKYYI